MKKSGKKHILVVCQHYWPEPFPIEDYCEELARRGHTVSVITGVPNYPMGEIYNEYRNKKGRDQIHNGVTIHRTLTIPRKHNILFRMLNYYSFAISSSLYALKLKEDYDVVLTVQSSPVMMTTAALKYAKKHGKKAVIYCMDLWPASLKAGGISENSIIYKYFNRVSRKLYCQADKIMVTSKLFKKYFSENFGINDSKLIYMPQYADTFFEEMKSNKIFHKNKDSFNIVFAGNMGTAQSLPTILEAARILKSENINVTWHMVGNGSEYESSKKKAQEYMLDNVIFYGRKPKTDMPKYYSMADAMLVTLFKDELISYTLPAKVQSYMASGKPIIAAADGETPDIISQSECGLCAHSEDAKGLADCVKKFINENKYEEYSDNSRKFYFKHFSKERFMNQLEKILKDECEENI